MAILLRTHYLLVIIYIYIINTCREIFT
jgi:hypothetical protein